MLQIRAPRSWFASRLTDGDNMLSRSLRMTFAALMVSSCVAESEEAPAPEDSDLVHRTIVRYLPDGSLEQSFETVTREEQQAELDARAERIEAARTGTPRPSDVLQRDAGCAGSSLWLFAGTNLSGAQLCLSRPFFESTSFLDLATVCRLTFQGICVATWSDAIRSLWGGSDPGNILACDATKCFTGLGNSFTFAPFERLNTVSVGSSAPRNMASLFRP